MLAGLLSAVIKVSLHQRYPESVASSFLALEDPLRVNAALGKLLEARGL